MGTVRYTVVNGQVVAENRNGVRKTYVPDPSGSTIALLDDKQKITDTFSYSPFGELKSRTGTTPTPFQYIGTRGYYTNPSNRVYVRARTYQSSYARWMTVDPLWPGESAYGYARNNPVRWGDLNGTSVQLCDRPVIDLWLRCARPIRSINHWFLKTSECGCIGYGRSGVILSCKENLADWPARTMDCQEYRHLTSQQERCLCDLAFKAKRGWRVCGRTWMGGEYDLWQQNCQDFVACLLIKCGSFPPNDSLDFGPCWSCWRKYGITKPRTGCGSES